jgi:hypothetical protein
MFSSLARLLNRGRVWGATKPPSNNRRPHVPRRASLQVECLEQRDVPTIAFIPNFGREAITGSISDGMKDPPVILLFSGNYWSTTQGQQDKAVLENSARAIMSGPYLSGLTQYGSDGKVFLMQSLSVPNAVAIATSGPNAGTADPNKLQDFLNDRLNEGVFGPGDNDWQHAPIYMVISDPNSSQGSNAGWNAQGQYERTFWDYENIHMVWLSTATGADGHVSKDGFTDLFSHELVETMSDPDSNGIIVTPPSALPASLKATGVNQIADNEADGGRYMYRLGGDLVQAYWSFHNQAFIVPDGNSQLVVLRPSWTGATFNKTFTLSANGDQFGANFADKITLDATVNRNVTLNLNQQSFVFEPGTITTIDIDTITGSNTVQINAVPTGVTALNLQSDTGTDAITIGNGTLAAISTAATINVENLFGQTSLSINGYHGAAANVTILDRSIVYNAVTITYVTSIQNGHACGVTSIEINAANGSRIDAERVGYFTMITVDVGADDPVTGPAANQLVVKRRLKIYYPVPVYVGTTVRKATIV